MFHIRHKTNSYTSKVMTWLATQSTYPSRLSNVYTFSTDDIREKTSPIRLHLVSYHSFLLLLVSRTSPLGVPFLLSFLLLLSGLPILLATMGRPIFLLYTR